MAITRPITSELQRAIEEAIEISRNKDGKLKTDVNVTRLSGNKHGYLSVTGEHTGMNRAGKLKNKPDSFGMLHGEIKKHHPNGKYDLAMKYHLHTFAPDQPEHGEPMHAQANAHYHAGIGHYSKESAGHLAHHLVTSYDHAQSIIDSIKHLPTDEDKKKVVNAHIDALRPKWREEMNTIAKQHNLK